MQSGNICSTKHDVCSYKSQNFLCTTKCYTVIYQTNSMKEILKKFVTNIKVLSILCAILQCVALLN